MASRLRYCSRKILRLIRKAVYKSLSLMRDVPGIFLDLKVTRLRQRVVFRDKFGFQFWLYPGDEVRLICKRDAVGDSMGVVRFVLDHVKREDTCIDIGASQAGVSVPMWSRSGLSGKVYSVEADPAKIERIKANLKLNGFRQDYVVNAAISDRVEIRSFRCYPKAPGWNTFGNPTFARDYDSFKIDVNCVNFGRLLESLAVDVIDFVKIDAEGSELLILNGMKPYLTMKQVGYVIFEVNPLMLPSMGATVQNLISFWDDLPYRLYRLNEDGNIYPLSVPWPESIVGDCIAIVERDEIPDHFAH